MKKYIYLAVVLFTGIFQACDYNEHYFDNFEENTAPKNVASYEYTFQDSDVSAIVSGLRANKTKADSILANAFNSAKIFSEALPASELMPYLLKDKYKAGDVGSMANITYQYDEKRNSILTDLTNKSYEVTAADYKLIWGEPYPMAFTPKKAPAKNVPTILLERFKDAKKGEFKNITYQYSEKEPVDATAIGETILEDDFEDYAANNVINKNGWQSIDLQGTYNWQAKTYGGNFYAEVSSYKSTGDNEIWMISPQIDLSKISSPHLSFDICVRNFTHELLTVLVSKDFDGTNVASATWTNISNKFTIPAPAASMNDFADAGMGSLSDYNGQKVYVAFKYVGNGTTGKTTTYRIDNAKVFEAVPGLAVEKSNTVYAAYEFDGSAWKASTNLEILQPENYAEIGQSYFEVENAPGYIDIYLKREYPFDQEGATRTVVYKTNNSNRADEYILKNKVWAPNTFIVTKTDQFVFADIEGVKQWIYDPTLTIVMDKPDYQILADYVKVNQAVDNPALWDTRGNAEFYYGFSAYYPNVSYRDKDRSNDPLYPINGSDTDKEKFCDQRTIEAIEVFLSQKYPDATPIVSGVVQYAKVTLKIYSSHTTKLTNETWTYQMQCTGNKEWKFVQRESLTREGHIEKAEK